MTVIIEEDNSEIVVEQTTNDVNIEQTVNNVDIEQADNSVEVTEEVSQIVVQSPGPQGVKGEAALTFEVGDTTTLEPGSPATVENVGTDADIVLDFGIPQGEKGDKGDKGDTGERGLQGEQGDPGPTIYPSAGIALSTGTAWDTSITNNSTNWNTAYGWGDHAGLYEPINTCFKLDQSTPQSVTGGIPTFVEGVYLGDNTVTVNKDGSGNLTFIDAITGTKTLAQLAAGGGGVTGNDTEVLFNDAGSTGADEGMTYNKTTDVLSLTGGLNLFSANKFTVAQDGVNTIADVDGGYYKLTSPYRQESGTSLFIDMGPFRFLAGHQETITQNDDSFTGANDEFVIDIGMDVSKYSDGYVDNYGTDCLEGQMAHRFYCENTRTYQNGNIDVFNAGVYGAVGLSSDIDSVGATLRTRNMAFYSDIYFLGKETSGVHNSQNFLFSGLLETAGHSVISGSVLNAVLYADTDSFIVEATDETHMILDLSSYPWTKRADNSKITMGAGDDFETYWDGSVQIIDPHTVGNGGIKIITGDDTSIETDELSIDLSVLVPDLVITTPVLKATAHSTLPETLPFPYALGVYDRIAIFTHGDFDNPEIIFLKPDFSNAGSIGMNLTDGYAWLNWDWCPNEDDTYSLGLSDLRWQDGWFSGNVYGNSDLYVKHAVYSDSTTQTISSTTVPWAMTFNTVEHQHGITLGKTGTVTITNASPAVISWAGHGLYVDSPVVFSTDGTLPTGLAAGTKYYIISAGFGTDAFQVSDTPQGAAINTSSDGSGTHAATNTSVIEVSDSGCHGFIFSTLCTATTSGTDIDIWFRKNGTNLDRTNTRIQIPNNNSTLCAVADVAVDLLAGDKMEMFWVGSSTNAQLLAIAAQTNPTRPATPSTIMTVKKISK